MRIALSVLLALHGTIHLLGFVKGFGLAAVEGLKLPVGRPAAALWLLAAVGFAASAVLLHAAPRHWSIVGLPALLLSQALIVRFWSDARFGTIANLIVLVPIVLAPGALVDLPVQWSTVGPRSVRGLFTGACGFRHGGTRPGRCPRVTSVTGSSTWTRSLLSPRRELEEMTCSRTQS